MNTTEISVKNFSISIENREILKNISVDIPKNQITVIIGPSGCGKSTLLRSMNRMTDLVEQVKTDGEIIIGGRNVLDPGSQPFPVAEKCRDDCTGPQPAAHVNLRECRLRAADPWR